LAGNVPRRENLKKTRIIKELALYRRGGVVAVFTIN